MKQSHETNKRSRAKELTVIEIELVLNAGEGLRSGNRTWIIVLKHQGQEVTTM